MNKKQLETNPKKFQNSSRKQATSKRAKPPVFAGFKVYKNDENGFFIINNKDGSIFKWIDVRSLKCNGVFEGYQRHYRSGRRNFEGYVSSIFRDKNRIEYVESDVKNFQKATRLFGGFYISVSRARYNSEREIAYLPFGPTVDLINFATAKENAEMYSQKYSKKNDFISALPCGAAMDCVSEEIYERFEKEVLEVKKEDESMYDAWNRHSDEVHADFRKNGIYGIRDLIFPGAEITSESFSDIKYQCAVRGGARGMFLISYYDFEKEMMDCYFEIGHRNFISTRAEFEDYGYRIVLLPQK